MELRDYQANALSKIWLDLLKYKSALCVMATGAGKSVVMNALIERSVRLKPDIKILVLFNKVDLLEQLSDRLKAVVSDVGNYCAGIGEKSVDKTVTFASIQSISKVAELLRYHLIIIDECHAVTGREEGQYFNFINSMGAKNDRMKVVGFTATPFRPGTGYIYGNNRLFPRITVEIGIEQLIKRGFLVPPVLQTSKEHWDTSGFKIHGGEYSKKDLADAANNDQKSRAQVIDALSKIQGRKKIIWFCINIAHAENVLREIESHDEKAAIIHSKQPRTVRLLNKRHFEEMDARHLVFVTIAAEGWDYPPADTLVILRPTRSATLWVQVAGRILRPHGDKKDALVLDYGEVIKNLGPLNDPIVEHGGKGKTKRRGELDPQELKLRLCNVCLKYSPPKTEVCPFCSNIMLEKKVNLTKAPDSKSNIIGERTKIIREIFDVKRVDIWDHESRSGNQCVKIDYHGGWQEILGHKVIKVLSEYFVKGSVYGEKRFRKRMFDLGLKPHIRGAKIECKKPKKIKIEDTGRFQNIVEVVM